MSLNVLASIQDLSAKMKASVDSNVKNVLTYCIRYLKQCHVVQSKAKSRSKNILKCELNQQIQLVFILQIFLFFAYGPVFKTACMV